MEDIELKPSHSTVNVPGKCLKCLAEQEYGNCLREMLTGEEGKEAAQQRFELVMSLLNSPELAKLRDECERHLADGKEVSLAIHGDKNNPEYEIRVGNTEAAK